MCNIIYVIYNVCIYHYIYIYMYVHIGWHSRLPSEVKACIDFVFREEEDQEMRVQGTAKGCMECWIDSMVKFW